MSDLISKGNLLNKIGKECRYDTEKPLESYSKLLEVINDAPTIEAEPVVRCKDCKWCNPLRAGEKIEEHGICTSPSAIERIIGMYAMAHGFIVNVNHYCGYGERR